MAYPKVLVLSADKGQTFTANSEEEEIRANTLGFIGKEGKLAVPEPEPVVKEDIQPVKTNNPFNKKK